MATKTRINLDAVGTVLGPVERSWTADQALLYAVGVGAGFDELAFTTENSIGVEQAVLPTFATVIGAPERDLSLIGDIDRTKAVHGDEHITLYGAIPTSGRISVTSTITGIEDKGSGLLLTIEATSTDLETGEKRFTVRRGAFFRGAGGFSERRTPSAARPPIPDREPDQVVEYPTQPDQPLIYRLSGDRNPLHSDPQFAQRAGFPAPIMHGLCTYGFTGRALLRTLCDGDPARFVSMFGRFSKPAMPGESLLVRIWRVDDTHAIFQTAIGGDGRVVIDQGQAEFR